MVDTLPALLVSLGALAPSTTPALVPSPIHSMGLHDMRCGCWRGRRCWRRYCCRLVPATLSSRVGVWVRVCSSGSSRGRSGGVGVARCGVRCRCKAVHGTSARDGIRGPGGGVGGGGGLVPGVVVLGGQPAWGRRVEATAAQGRGVHADTLPTLLVQRGTVRCCDACGARIKWLEAMQCTAREARVGE